MKLNVKGRAMMGSADYQAETIVREDEVMIEVSDDCNPEFWLHVHLTHDQILDLLAQIEDQQQPTDEINGG